MNSYRLSPTTPSRWRVYQFHHLGTRTYGRLVSPGVRARTGFAMAGAGGLEPPTRGFGDRCSTILSYAPSATL